MNQPQHAITKENIDRVLSFLPNLESLNQDYGEWVNKKGQMPYYDLSPRMSEFMHALYSESFIISFDWPNWEEGKRIINDAEAIRSADLLTILKLFTALVRSDRFVEGSFAAAIKDGIVLKLMRRLHEIRGDMD